MSGLTTKVLLRSAFTASDSGRVTQLLRAIAPDVSEARKGRHWDFTVSNAVVSLSVLSTSDHEQQFEDELLANGLLFDDAPDAFLLTFPTNRECDREICAELAAKLADTFEGINCG
ncbi:MAG: hypothetical protein WBH50_25550 [Fuerstiella sp.]